MPGTLGRFGRTSWPSRRELTASRPGNGHHQLGVRGRRRAVVGPPCRAHHLGSRRPFGAFRSIQSKFAHLQPASPPRTECLSRHLGGSLCESRRPGPSRFWAVIQRRATLPSGGARAKPDTSPLPPDQRRAFLARMGVSYPRESLSLPNVTQYPCPQTPGGHRSGLNWPGQACKLHKGDEPDISCDVYRAIFYLSRPKAEQTASHPGFSTRLSCVGGEPGDELSRAPGGHLHPTAADSNRSSG